MTYLAIARKYRPATFDAIVGQEHVTRTLRNAIDNDRIHHAYLFTGARGVGKTTAARALARALNCEQGPTPDPCGTCTSCVEIGHGASPDLIEIDGASNNSVEDVREIREAVQYAPSRGKWKIYLVDEVHMLSRGAFNALLKTLEEPPPHVVFIFATTEPNKIPDTILSRVQRFDFKRIPVPKVVERLAEIASKEGVNVPETGLRLIARAGEGSMRDAQSLLDQVISYGGDALTDEQIAETLGLIDRSLLHAFVSALVHGDAAACLEVIERVYSFGYELSVFTGEVLDVLRNATFLRLSPDARRFVDLGDDEVDALSKVVDGVEAERLTRLFTALLETHDQVAHAGRPRIVLEMAVARLATTRPVQPLEALLGRLEHLERGLRGASPPAGRPAGGRSRAPSGPDPRTPRGPHRGRSRTSSTPTGSNRDGSPPSREPSPRAEARMRGPDAAVAHPTPQPAQIQHSEAPPLPDDTFVSPAAPWGPLSAGSLADVPIERGKGRVTRRMAGRAQPAAPKKEAPPDTPWGRFVSALQEADPELAVLGEGIPRLERSTLRIRIRAGRTLVRAQRALENPAVAAALAASYPRGTTLALESGRGGKIDAAQLEREFLQDPALARIVQVLEARVERVEPHDFPDEASDDAASRSDT